MKKLRNILLMAAILMVLMLAGCSGNFSSIAIDTTLTVDTSFNGSRVMTAEIPAAVYKYAFGSNVDALEDVISKYTPGDMYCLADENEDGSARIEMHIDFASRNEYQKKIETICSGNKSETAIKPVITFDYSRSMLKNGYTIEENFTSLDLFYWLSEALITEYPALEGKDVSEVFELGKTEVVFDGQTIEMDGNIQISNIVSNAFDGLSVAATLNEDESIDAEITYVVSNKIVASLGDKLETMMDELLPEGADLTYQDDESTRTYTITFHRDTFDAYITGMNKALRANNTVFEVTTEGDTDSLAAKKTVKQYYDGSYFLDFTDENTVMAYILRVSPEYTVESCTGVYGYLRGESSSYGKDNCEITMTVASSDEVNTVLGFAVDIDEVDITTDIHSSTRIERTIDFKLSTDADVLIGSSIKERLDAAAAQWAETGKMTVKRDAVISNVQYSIWMEADSAEELTAMTLAVLGSSSEDDNSNDELTGSLFAGGPEKHKNPWRMHYNIEDTLNLSKFLRGSQVSKGIRYKLTYPKYYRASFVETNMFEDAAADGAVITCSTYNKVLTVKSTAEKANIEGIVIFGLWAASLILLIILAVLNLTHIVYFISNKKLDIDGAALFKGKYLRMLAVAGVAIVCFVFMTIRLLFKIY